MTSVGGLVAAGCDAAAPALVHPALDPAAERFLVARLVERIAGAEEDGQQQAGQAYHDRHAHDSEC